MESKWISETSPDDKVMLRVVDKKGSAKNFYSIVRKSVEGNQTSIYIDPVKYEDKYLNFDNVQVTAEITVGNLLYKYALSSIILVKREGVLYHKCTCHAPSAGVNRRQSVRIPFSCKGCLQLGSNKKYVDCSFVDISYGGAGVIFKELYDVNVGDVFTLTFSHDGTPYRCSAHVVRSEKMEDQGSTFLGLKFVVDYGTIRNLITKLQRNDLKRINHNMLRY